jgi:hypothetical protein
MYDPIVLGCTRDGPGHCGPGQGEPHSAAAVECHDAALHGLAPARRQDRVRLLCGRNLLHTTHRIICTGCQRGASLLQL